MPTRVAAVLPFGRPRFGVEHDTSRQSDATGLVLGHHVHHLCELVLELRCIANLARGGPQGHEEAGTDYAPSARRCRLTSYRIAVAAEATFREEADPLIGMVTLVSQSSATL